eukprot:jgi/Chrzof1/13407/Cz07g31250.t1
MNGHDDELYSGYDDSPSSGLGAAPAGSMFQPMEAASTVTAATGPPGIASTRMGTASMRQGTASTEGMARPMTSNRGAGFTSTPKGKFDPFNQGRGPLTGTTSSLLAKKSEASPEEVARDMERKVHELLEESAALSHKGDHQAGLDKVLEAKKKERSLAKFRDANALSDQTSPELTFAVDFQIAHMYAANKLYQEALDGYTAIVRNKQVAQGGRLRINMGNIYFEQGKYPAAIKMYRMALDTLPAAATGPRGRILRNIGVAFVRMGQYADAAGAFDAVMESAPDHQAAHNLVVCSYALGDKEGMKTAFEKLLAVPGLAAEQDDDAEEDEDDDYADDTAGYKRQDSRVPSAGLKGPGLLGHGDGLKDQMRKKQAYIKKCILTAAQLISERIDRSSVTAGFDWCAEQLRQAGFVKLAAEVQLAKAGHFLFLKDVAGAAAVFKDFDKKESVVRARAATNLSFLYLLEGSLENAAKYTDLALKTDRYNAKAHVNRGVLLMEAGSLEEARQAFTDATTIEPLCAEALYNLGVVNLRLQEPESALIPLRKLHAMLPDSPEVVHCIALAHDMMADTSGAIRWLEMLSTLVPNDPGVLCKLGAIYHRLDEEAKSLQYYHEAHRVWPVNLDVISWLGAFHVRNEMYEKAIPYFDLASRIQPSEVKWALMVASCYRRIGAYPQALKKYREIAGSHPDNVECLRYLVHLCQELGRADDCDKYMDMLRRAERSQCQAHAPESISEQLQCIANVQAAEAQATAAIAAQSQQASTSPNTSAGGATPSYMQQADASAPSALDSQLAAKQQRRMVVREAGGQQQQQQQQGVDDWGDEGLGEDLLPM